MKHRSSRISMDGHSMKNDGKTHHDTTDKKNNNVNEYAFLKIKPVNKTAVQLASRGIESRQPTPRLITEIPYLARR